jgi:hypothetical protein
MIEEFLFNEKGLLPNRADPCTYSGIYKSKPVILCQATDDFILCKDTVTYEAMIVNFRKKWTVHTLEEVKLFFGICFICSKNCITLDQTHKIKTLIIYVFSPSYNRQALSGQGYTTPMIAGTNYQACQ